MRRLVWDSSFRRAFKGRSIVLEANGDGFLATVPGLQGAFAEGDTVEEAIFNCVDVVNLIVAYRRERGE